MRELVFDAFSDPEPVEQSRIKTSTGPGAVQNAEKNREGQLFVHSAKNSSLG